MKDRGIYPLTISFYEEHPELASRTMISRRPHGDGFVGLAELMTADITGECFDDIRVGERLEVTAGSSGRSRRIPVLTVGSEALGVIGEIPFSESILPGELLLRGGNIYCFAEAKSFRPADVRILVSIYAEY